jgi:SPP1 gp7 family putative phage head morphogenesis protein
MKRPRSDPAKGTKLIKAYEKALKTLVKQYRDEVIKSLKYSAGERSLEAPQINETILFQSIAMISTAIAAAASGIVAESVMKAYLQGDAYAKAHVNAVQPSPDLQVGASFNLPVSQETINHLNRRQNLAFQGITDAMSNRIHLEISTGIQSGESIYQITDRIQRVSSDIGFARAEAMARTETMNALNQGSLDRYIKAGFTKVQWLAAEDERTCTRALPPFMGKVYMGCRDLDGRIFDIDKVPPIPAHVSCRCCTIPVPEREASAPMDGYRLLHEGPTPPRFAANGDVWIVTE